jgi:hypothetical protein
VNRHGKALFFSSLVNTAQHVLPQINLLFSET